MERRSLPNDHQPQWASPQLQAAAGISTDPRWSDSYRSRYSMTIQTPPAWPEALQMWRTR